MQADIALLERAGVCVTLPDSVTGSKRCCMVQVRVWSSQMLPGRASKWGKAAAAHCQCHAVHFSQRGSGFGMELQTRQIHGGVFVCLELCASVRCMLNIESAPYYA